MSWDETLKCLYIGIYSICFRSFKCLFVEANCAKFRSLNAIFGKVGRFISAEVVLQLVPSKCLSGSWGLDKSDFRSLDDFFVIRFFL